MFLKMMMITTSEYSEYQTHLILILKDILTVRTLLLPEHRMQVIPILLKQDILKEFDYF